MNKVTKKIIVNTMVVTLLLLGIGWIASTFIHFGGAWTENAQVRRDMVTLSARVPGFVSEVRFKGFQKVSKGDTLVLVEDSEYRLHVAQAEADLENARAGHKAMGTGISATENNLAVSDAALEEVRVQYENAERDYKRFKELYAKEAVTRQQLEGVQTQYEALKARMQTMQTQKRTTRLVKAEQQQRLSQSEGGIAICEAALQLAKINLSYTVVTAPCDGYVSDKFIQEGQLVNPGTPLVVVISDAKPWVIANYRENQMASIAVGDRVQISVDALGGRKFEGRVSAVATGTGASFSPMAPDNSTGNYVKVVQKIPVKIDFEAAEGLDALASGMSVECKVSRK